MSTAHRLRTLSILAITAALLALSTATAAAQLSPPPPPPPGACQVTGQGTICQYSDVFVIPLNVATRDVPGCATLILNATIERHFTVFYDAQGTLVRQLRHVAFTGSITNATTGNVAPYQGHFNLVFDYADGTLTRTGDFDRVVVPGSGVLTFAAGTQVTAGEFVDSEVLFQSTRGDLAAFFADVCAALQ